MEKIKNESLPQVDETSRKQIPVGQILYNLGYWITLAQDYFKQVNNHIESEKNDGDC